MIALGIIAVTSGALRLTASAVAADAKGRRDAVYWLVAGSLTALLGM